MGPGSVLMSPCPCPPLLRGTHHSHLGEVDQAVLRVVGRTLFDEGQVSEVHPQVRDTGRVATLKQTALTEVFHLKRWRLSQEQTHPCGSLALLDGKGFLFANS